MYSKHYISVFTLTVNLVGFFESFYDFVLVINTFKNIILISSQRIGYVYYSLDALVSKDIMLQTVWTPANILLQEDRQA